MSDQDAIHQYLESLKTYLARLEPHHCEDVLKEIECHLLDAYDMAQRDSSTASIQTVIEGFGPPRELASSYIEHVLHGSLPPRGFRPITTLKSGATKSLRAAMAVYGYGIATILSVLGIAKIFAPQHLGVWAVAEGNAIRIAFMDTTIPESSDLFGLWLIPISLVSAIAMALLTRQILIRLEKQI